MDSEIPLPPPCALSDKQSLHPTTALATGVPLSQTIPLSESDLLSTVLCMQQNNYPNKLTQGKKTLKQIG